MPSALCAGLRGHSATECRTGPARPSGSAAAAAPAQAMHAAQSSVWLGSVLPSLPRSHRPRGCGALHTQGHRAFVEWLTDEIEGEKAIWRHKSLPKMSGSWELEVYGTEAKLVQKVAGEKITVPFNINNSILPTFDGEKEPFQGQKVEE